MTQRTRPAGQIPEEEAILLAHHLNQMIDGSSSRAAGPQQRSDRVLDRIAWHTQG